MRITATSIPLLGSLLLPSALAVLQDLNNTVAAAPLLPGAFIVELEDGECNVAVEPRLDLSYSLFKGCSFQLHNASDVGATAREIERMPKVRKMWPVRLRDVPKDEVVWAGNDTTAATPLRKRRDAGGDTYSPHVMTQVDKLREEGITGSGIRIGIVDTGVDYNHPALGSGCFGEGCLISYGTDMVGDNYTGYNTPVPDSDPYDNCQGHGSHVSGIIAAGSNPLGFTGAAPDVTLGMYRVFGCSGSVTDDILIAAFNQAFEDGSDIITASIGGPSGWTEDPWAVAVQRIVEAGVPCTVSAGNDGSSGLFFASSAANGKKVTAVASIQNIETPVILTGAVYSLNNSSSVEFGWEPGNPSYINITLPLWAVSNDTEVEDDACDTLPDDTPDLSALMVLIRQGTCAFYQKAQNVAAKGAKYIMLYSNIAETQLVYVADIKKIVAAGMVTASQGAEWVDLLNQGQQVSVTITDPDISGEIVDSAPNTNDGGLPNYYTSWGPTWEVDLKPQMAAPGGNILSTYPLDLGGYAVLSGTSMACPLTAAIYALVAQARGRLDPSLLERVLSSTATPTSWVEGTGNELAPVPQQGAGLIQAFDAAHVETILSVASISFNDTVNFMSNVTFTIQNLGPDEVTYELRHNGAITAYTFEEGDLYPAFYPNPTVDAHATLEFSSSKMIVPAGAAIDVTVTPTPPSGLDEARLPVYSGYITINGTNGDSLSIPYLGVVGSMYSAPTMFDPNYVYLSNYTDRSTSPVEANKTFAIPYPTDATSEPDTSIGFPMAVMQLNVGTPLLRCDVVPVDVKGNITTVDVFGVGTVGSVLGFPLEYSQRTYYLTPFTGMLNDGTTVPEGRYSFLVRALRIFGDRDAEEDYDTVGMVPFDIIYS
ncbi:subtilisin-like protein [Xylariaceae sp. FL0016]|nr:subtilisin-like protein [Xylariaceae sp. FL0016]